MARKKADPEVAEDPVEESTTTITAVIPAGANGGEMAPVIPLHNDAGTYALAMLNEDDFQERLEILKRGRDRIAQIQRELMEVNVDYGLIPGTPKPTLFKSGAEKLALIYRLAARMEAEFTPGDGEKQPPLRYSVACFLHHGTFDGPVVAVGHGTANSWEKRYRRESNKACPNCGKTTIIRSKFDPGWYCFEKKGGCGKKFAKDDPAIVEQGTDARGDPVEANDLQNTLLKMAEKRAFVDAVLRATASSSLFTQDVAEEPADETQQADYDGPVEVTKGGAVVNTDGEVVERRESTPEPVETRTATATVQRGGHVDDANTAQISQVTNYSKALKLGPYKLADEIAELFGGGIDSTMLDGETVAAATQLMEFLKSMSSTDIGKLITHLRKKAESQ
jgi:ribosomal protein L37AE/L43A